MDARPFEGMTAVVTGGAQRIGKVIALRLGTLGANVAVHYHQSGAPAQALCGSLQEKGVKAVALQADLSQPEGPRDLVARAGKVLGAPVDFLVNNASEYPAADLPHLTWDDLAAALRLGAWAPLELMRALHAQLPARGGAVVNLLDARIADYDLAHAGYFLAKRMLADMTRIAAIEFAPLMRVNGVAPGPILPPRGGLPEDLARWAKHTPLQRPPTPDDVADAVLYLLGARGVTGDVVYVDGGRHLGRAVYG